MEAPQLNIDVLTIVCEFLTDVSDLLSVSLTCSSINVVAVRWLLRTRQVHLKSGASICRFHSFLFADAPARAPYVHALDIDLMWPQPEAEDATLLLEILASCNGLQHLTIAFRYEAFSIMVDPQFLQTIAAIPSLRSFTVRSSPSTRSQSSLSSTPPCACSAFTPAIYLLPHGIPPFSSSVFLGPSCRLWRNSSSTNSPSSLTTTCRLSPTSFCPLSSTWHRILLSARSQWVHSTGDPYSNSSSTFSPRSMAHFIWAGSKYGAMKRYMPVSALRTNTRSIATQMAHRAHGRSWTASSAMRRCFMSSVYAVPSDSP